MPNICDNCVKFYSDNIETKREIKKLLNGKTIFDFNKVIPMPENSSVNQFVDNWGTKWNAFDIEMVFDGEDDEDEEVCYDFNTAWWGCVPVIDKLAEMFPDVEIEYVCGEMCENTDMKRKYKDGVCISEERADYGTFHFFRAINM